MLRKKGNTGSDEKLVNNAVNNILKKKWDLHIAYLGIDYSRSKIAKTVKQYEGEKDPRSKTRPLKRNQLFKI